MANISYGWLKDYNNNEFIPITHSTKVFNDSGISVESRLLSAETELDTKLSLTEYGIEISKNADLNTLPIGQYYATKEIAKTLTNCPTQWQFKFIHMQGSDSTCSFQLIFTEDEREQHRLFYRCFLGSRWSPWYNLNNDDEVLQLGFNRLQDLNSEPDWDYLIEGTYSYTGNDRFGPCRLIVIGGSQEGQYHQMLMPDKSNDIYVRSTISDSTSSLGVHYGSWVNLNTTLEDLGITVSTEEINHLQNISSNIQEQFNNKTTVKIVRWS